MSLSVTTIGPAHAPALLFLPGLGSAADSWTDIASLLPEHRCLLVDLPGHGDSRDTPWRGFEDAAKKVLETVGTEVHQIVGLSQGAYLATHVLNLAPKQFETALISGLQAQPIPSAWKYRLMIAGLAPFMKLPAVLRKNAAAMGLSTDKQARFVEGARKTRIGSMRRAFSDATAYSIPRAVSEVTTRVLIAAGENEQCLILEGQFAFKEAFSSAKAVRIAGAGHIWPFLNEELFVQVLRAHLDDTNFPSGVLEI